MRVATIYNAGRHSKVGPAKNIARLYSNQELFLENGVELLGPFVPDQGIDDLQSYEKSTGFKVKQLVKRAMRATKFGTLALLRATQIRLSRMALDEYQEGTQDDVDLIVFRDFITAHEYLRAGGKKPYVLVMHNDGTPDMFFAASSYAKLGKGWTRKKLNGWFEEVFEKASGFLFLSDEARCRFKSRYPSIDCVVGTYHQGLEKPPAVDPLSEIEADGTVFVSVGTVCERKNQRGIIEAFSQIGDSDSVLVIVGEGEDLPFCQELSKEAGLEDRVVFTGSLENVGDALSVSDVFVSASFDEGVPNAAVEAMSYGLPLILTDVGSCAMLLENENGILIEPDIDQLRGAMSSMAERPSLRTECGARSLELYEKSYGVDGMCREHCDMYVRTLRAVQGA